MGFLPIASTSLSDCSAKTPNPSLPIGWELPVIDRRLKGFAQPRGL
jgi:hypothetical protein